MGNFTPEKAIKDFDLAIRWKPDFGDAYFQWGVNRNRYNRSEVRLAIGDFKKAIKYKTSYVARAHINLGETNLQLGYYSLSVEAFDKAIEREPAAYHSYLWRADAKLKWGKHDDAVADYDRAIQITVERELMGYLGYIHCLLRKGYAMMKLGRYDVVIGACDKIIQRIPEEFSKPYELRGDAKIRLADYSGAMMDYESCLQIKLSEDQEASSLGLGILPSLHTHAALLYRIGLLKWKLGLYDAARGDLMETQGNYYYDVRVNRLLQHL